MLGENTYHGTDEAARLAALVSESGMDARLNDPDRRAVDFLLSGEAVEGKDAEMSRIQAAKRLFAVLGAMPTEEPTGSLAEATMRKVASAQPMSAQNPPSASASA